MLCSRVMVLMDDLVSIHAPRCRGAMLRWRLRADQAVQVSIHAPRCRGAMPQHAASEGRSDPVSIHAPRCRGAMRGGCRQSLRRHQCFNPRSPLPGSDAGQVGVVPPAADVSIHAPRCRGAMPPCFSAAGSAALKFQSTLPVAGERCAGCSAQCARCTRFNPRSPLPGSDAGHLRSSCRAGRVSIHAPRCRGAMRWTAHGTAPSRRWFQSTLPVAGERCKRDICRLAAQSGFNPRSPLPGSDAH